MNRKQRRAQGKAPGFAPLAPNIQALFADALRLYQSGRIQDAEQVCRRILPLAPDFIPAMDMLASIAFQTGRPSETAVMMRKSIAIDGKNPQFNLNLGYALHALGQLDDAARIFRRVLELAPGSLDGLTNLASVLKDSGRFDEAIVCFQKALVKKPDYAEVHNNLGGIFRELDRLEDAIPCFEAAIRCQPRYVDAHANLGHALRDMKRPEDAMSAYMNTLELAPNHAEALSNLGAILLELGQTDQAFRLISQAISLKPDYARAHCNMGVVQMEVGQFDMAEQSLNRSIDLDPNDAETRFNLAFLNLVQGRYDTGWLLYEWRHRLKSHRRYAPRFAYSQPVWRGEPPFSTGTLLIWGEQGLGDSIQFVRFIRGAVDMGWRVLLDVPPPLRRLFSGLEGAFVIDDAERLPEFDAHCPMMSLPQRFGVTLEGIFGQPYLFPAESDVSQWSETLSTIPGLKVGLNWRGNPDHTRDRTRSLSAAEAAPLAGIPGVTLVSLQRDGTDAELSEFKKHGEIVSFGPDIGDFAKTAALLKTLDLVISIDSAACHLAGSVGVPVWTLLEFTADWRWLLKRDDTPWYGSMRLFRQDRPGDWSSVINAVKAGLAVSVAGSSRG